MTPRHPLYLPHTPWQIFVYIWWSVSMSSLINFHSIDNKFYLDMVSLLKAIYLLFMFWRPEKNGRNTGKVGEFLKSKNVEPWHSFFFSLVVYDDLKSTSENVPSASFVPAANFDSNNCVLSSSAVFLWFSERNIAVSYIVECIAMSPIWLLLPPSVLM